MRQANEFRARARLAFDIGDETFEAELTDMQLWAVFRLLGINRLDSEKIDCRSDGELMRLCGEYPEVLA